MAILEAILFLSSLAFAARTILRLASCSLCQAPCFICWVATILRLRSLDGVDFLSRAMIWGPSFSAIRICLARKSRRARPAAARSSRGEEDELADGVFASRASCFRRRTMVYSRLQFTFITIHHTPYHSHHHQFRIQNGESDEKTAPLFVNARSKSLLSLKAFAELVVRSSRRVPGMLASGLVGGVKLEV